MSKFLLIQGSPRSGNTEFILNKIYSALDDSKELILLRDKNIGHCKGCLFCHNKISCIIKDDMEEIREKVLNAEVIIFGMPDLLPAMAKAKELGKEIEYIGFAHQPSFAMQRHATLSRLLIKEEVESFITVSED